jgi:hypothetical protein
VNTIGTRSQVIDGAGLCIGVSTYTDPRLTSCPSAARTAEALALELAPCFSNGVRAVIDPKQSYDLFLAIQTSIQKARGGVFVLYFAGITIRRGDDLLLTTSGSSLEAKSSCVPWSDVDAILEQEKVPRGLVLMNAEGFAGVGWLGSARTNVHGMGSVRIHDPQVAEQRLAAYGDALLDALREPAHALRAHLSEGRLDVAALGRYLAARFPKPEGEEDARPKRGEGPRHETFGTPDLPADLVLRDLREDLARPPSVPSARPAARASGWRGFVVIALVVVVIVAGALLFWLLSGAR